ncbi:MAG: hypothetical protein IPG80_19570 [Anaerolineales bacterium]|uniref:hypothetical protein n=1 Tax=Candidatus Villigracilis vicinus TaxID=3140679 RepID=UPI0031372BE2|nr:hypothetical protein [Anaerolineales bacterium]
MFFGKKEPETPRNPIRITIVTDEYLIEAWDDPELSIFYAAYDSEVDDPTGGALILKDAYVKPLGKINTPARTFTQWRLPSFVKVIAILSDDPITEDIMAEAWVNYVTPFKSLLYAGAFTIEGTIFSEDDNPPDFALRTFVPLENSIITYQFDKDFKPIQGRWGVVNSVLMHGFSIEK